ncbi:polyhydroxybutyrate depolymerase [Ciceribacter sp. L1K23]|uniref:alpha/beta hydrolase family esterase n=1 Tax=Ciceribacter sp. L1K23 TaxID=2820276 RepID=UPI002010E272|nr:polyhydroxybutyrate depolymerase [Ciceribacter sp. L1K23]
MTTSAVFFRQPAWVRVVLATVFVTLVNSAALAAGCGPVFQSGRHDLKIMSDGVERSAVYFVPSAYDGKRKMPLVFDFHGSNSHPEGQMNRSHWDEIGEREGFMVIALQGSLDGSFKGAHAWNVPGVKPLPGVSEENGLDEEQFIRDAVAYAKETFCVDPARIYATGYSGGGRMLSQFICNGNSEFAAAGFMMGLRAGYPEQEEGVWRPRPDTCKPAKPISIIAFSGLKDDVNPFSGGGKPYWQYGGKVAVGRWAELNGCDMKPMTGEGEEISVSSYVSCKNGVGVMSYVIADAGHSWPSQKLLFQLASTGNQPSREVDATGRIWDFFQTSGGGLLAGQPGQAACPTAKNAGPDSTGGQGKTCSQPLGSASSEPAVVGDL